MSKKEVAGEALRELVLEKLSATAAKYDRSTPKGRLKAEAIDAIAKELGGADVWTRVPPRGRRPKLSREHISATAVRLADEEGVEALSMRRIATELNVGTMSLYHYVRTKDELLALVADAVMGEVVVPPDTKLPADWREALTILANRTWAVLRKHPWTLDINDDPPIGPNSVRHFDQSLEAVASLDLPLADRLDIVALVDEYVFGYALGERNSRSGHEIEDDDRMVEYVGVLLETGAYPQLEALTKDADLRTVWRDVNVALRDNRRFERNLVRLLDGIAASLPRH